MDAALDAALESTWSWVVVTSAEAARTLANFAPKGSGYIFNLGSGILPKTPLDSVQALWDTVLDGSAKAEGAWVDARPPMLR